MLLTSSGHPPYLQSVIHAMGNDERAIWAKAQTHHSIGMS